MFCSLIVAAAVITAQPLVDEDVLEPSVQNEVDHAISLASTNEVTLTCAAVAFAELYATNGMSTTSRAVSLVSTQKGGKWFHDGADVTPVAVEVWRLAEKDRLSFMEAALKAEKLGFFAQGGSQPFNKE